MMAVTEEEDASVVCSCSPSSYTTHSVGETQLAALMSRAFITRQPF